MPSPRSPDSPAPTVPIVRGVRWLAHTVRRPDVAEPLSWLVWLGSVLVFALWTGTYYRAPAGPGWLGMTIRTGVFAIWAQVLREWLVLRLQRDESQRADRETADSWSSDD